MKKRIARGILNIINKILPKYEQVLIQGFPNTESSAIEVANYICSNYSIPVFFVVSSKSQDDPRSLLRPEVILVNRFVNNRYSINYLIKYVTSKYVFFTHGTILGAFSKRQVMVNIWHGVFYKPIRKLNGRPGLPANVTVGTSELTKKMFAEAFGVPQNSICVSGYPRNDALIKSNNNKTELRSRLKFDLRSYDNILVWLPTYRKSVKGDIRQDGRETGNPFYIEGFDVNSFNQLLSEYNSLCIVKPHPMAPQYGGYDDFSNLLFIDDEWISRQEITLYTLVGLSDILISDVSSIIIDYLLLDQPIICVSEDLELYKQTRGFYFDNIEEWLPSQVIRNQEALFSYLKVILSTKENPFKQKSEKLKKIFFEFDDAGSTQRLLEYVFSLDDSYFISNNFKQNGRLPAWKKSGVM